MASTTDVVHSDTRSLLTDSEDLTVLPEVEVLKLTWVYNNMSAVCVPNGASPNYFNIIVMFKEEGAWGSMLVKGRNSETTAAREAASRGALIGFI